MAFLRKNTESQTPKIKLVGVKKHFGSKKVLDGVDLDIYTGESLVIIGGSGTGKSVTLKCILGLLQPDKGYIEIDGKKIDPLPIKEQEKLCRQIGMLFQSGALFDSLNVWENVAFSLLQNQKMNRTEARQIAIEKLAQVGLNETIADVYPADLSGGMKKRLSLATVLINQPKVLLMDEPFAALDLLAKEEILSYMKEFLNNKGIIIAASHDKDLFDFCNHVFLLKDGTLHDTTKLNRINYKDMLRS